MKKRKRKDKVKRTAEALYSMADYCSDTVGGDECLGLYYRRKSRDSDVYLCDRIYHHGWLAVSAQ